MSHFDIVIVGGGIVGQLSARELAQAGAHVAVCDARELGQESSWAGGGIVSPLYPWRYGAAVTALANRAQVAYPNLCEQLLADTGIDAQYQQSGLLLTAVADRQQALSWAIENKKALRSLGRAQAQALQPGIDIDDELSLYFPEVAQVRNPRLMKALRADLLQRGVSIYEHAPVQQFMDSDRQINSVRAGAQILQAEQFVVCAGAWSAQLLGPLSTHLAVRPVRGQMLMFTAHEHPLQHIVLRNGRYLIPRRDGRILCGSTVEDVGFDQSTTEEAYASLHASALALMPSLRDVPVEKHWAGLRPGSPDGIPFIGRLTSHNNLWINAGHFRNGVVLAPAAAQLLADQILMRNSNFDARPYMPI